MSEITRENALSELKTFPISCLDFNEKRALEKAISDMQKLEKVEEAFNRLNVISFANLSLFTFRIEQILKGEQNE